MATVREVLRTNLEAAKQQVECFGFEPGKIKIKAIGGGEYRCWCYRGEGLDDWESIVPGEEAFDGDLMEELMVSFIESFDSIEPDLVNEKWGSYHDYSFVAGEDNDMLAESIKTIDCRMKNYDENELDVFWSTNAVDFIPEQLNEIIGEEPIVVYHRKGKDWCVSPRVENFDCEVYYLDDERDLDYWGQLEGTMAHLVSDESETVLACVEFIQGCKDDLELRCIARKLVQKTESFESFLSFYWNEDSLRDKAFEFCCDYYRSNNTGMGWNTGFNGDFPDLSDSETFIEFLKEFEQFQHQPELALKDSMNLYRLGEKLGFHSQFDFNGEGVAVEFIVGEEEYSVHVDANEFEECDRDWKTVLREYVIPQVARRRLIANQNALKEKIGNNLKEYASKLWVRFKDSIQAGNCQFGSEQFVKRHHLDLNKLGAIRGDYLLELEETEFTKRVIYSLAIQHSEELGLA